jgi:hypothetical protein
MTIKVERRLFKDDISIFSMTAILSVLDFGHAADASLEIMTLAENKFYTSELSRVL